MGVVFRLGGCALLSRWRGFYHLRVIQRLGRHAFTWAVEGMSLPKAISMVTATPARTVSLDDRGRIAPGLRADLVRVHRSNDVPVVRSVWREGRRVV